MRFLGRSKVLANLTQKFTNGLVKYLSFDERVQKWALCVRSLLAKKIFRLSLSLSTITYR